jgi:hypothetical protein
MPENTIYFQPTKKVKFARAFNHLVPGMLLLLLGIENLSHGESGHLVFALLGIAAGAALIISFIRDMRQTARTAPHGVHWFDIFAGIVIGLEAWHKYKPEKGFQPATLLFIVGVVTFLMGIFHGKLSRLARLTCDENGFLARISPFHKLQLAWKDISAVQAANNAIQIITANDARHKINLRRVENKNAVIDFFEAQWQRNKIVS